MASPASTAAAAAAAVVGRTCFFQLAAPQAQVPSSASSRSSLGSRPSLTSGPVGLSLTRRSSRGLSVTAIAAAALTLPTAKPERLPSDSAAPRWSARALKSVTLAEVQARNYRRTELGSDILLLGVLVDGTSEAAKYLRDIGVTVTKVREEIAKAFEGNGRYRARINIPLSDSSQKALDWAVDQKLKSGDNGEITVGHLVLGIWLLKESKGHKVLATLGFDSKKAKELSKIAKYDAPKNYR